MDRLPPYSERSFSNITREAIARVAKASTVEAAEHLHDFHNKPHDEVVG